MESPKGGPVTSAAPAAHTRFPPIDCFPEFSWRQNQRVHLWRGVGRRGVVPVQGSHSYAEQCFLPFYEIQTAEEPISQLCGLRPTKHKVRFISCNYEGKTLHFANRNSLFTLCLRKISSH